MGAISVLFQSIQNKLFPWLEENLPDPLTQAQREFVRVAELCGLEAHMRPYRGVGFGRPRAPRTPLALAFLAKAFFNVPTTKGLIEQLTQRPNLRRLCGWEAPAEIPSESTFSRAFEDFARGELPSKIHAAMIQANLGGKLMGHASHDSTSIEGREKPARAPKPAPQSAPAAPGTVQSDKWACIAGNPFSH